MLIGCLRVNTMLIIFLDLINANIIVPRLDEIIGSFG